jgi:hypothetical protein
MIATFAENRGANAAWTGQITTLDRGYSSGLLARTNFSRPPVPKTEN